LPPPPRVANRAVTARSPAIRLTVPGRPDTVNECRSPLRASRSVWMDEDLVDRFGQSPSRMRVRELAVLSVALVPVVALCIITFFAVARRIPAWVYWQV